ncbi:MAG: choice-of-anchor W domain-containing protein [Leptolyngbyaceae cyanobacterium]
MKSLHLTFGLATAVAMTLLADAAMAVSFQPLPGLSDTDFNQLIDDGTFSEDFIVESRSGNGRLNGTYEFAILEVEPPGPGGPPAAQGQFAWQNGVPVDFEVSYDGAGSVSYTVDGNPLNAFGVDDLTTGINALYIRTRSNNDGSVTELSNLMIDGKTYTGTVRSEDGDTIDYIKITDFSSAFTLTGQSTFSWTGSSIPTNSKLAYQIKTGYEAPSQSVPEPVGLSLLSLGMLGGTFAASRRPKN